MVQFRCRDIFAASRKIKIRSDPLSQGCSFRWFAGGPRTFRSMPRLRQSALHTLPAMLPGHNLWEAAMPQGKIKKLVSDRGFGFVESDDKDLFFHHSEVFGLSFEELKE